MFDGRRINKVAAYISVFAAASALFVAGVLTRQCSNDWAGAFSGILFITLGGGLWIWNVLVGIYLAVNALDLFALRHRHRLPIFRILAFCTFLGILVTSGITVSHIAMELQFREIAACLD